MVANSNPNQKLRRWLSIAGVDFHVLTTLLLRGWSILAGGITILLLPLYLSPAQQGYYFTFASVLALQIFFELGLSQIVMQLVSHEIAHLEPTADERLKGGDSHIGRLGSLVRLLSRWYGFAAVLFGVFATLAGWWFFAHRGSEPASTWLGAWLLVTTATAVNLWLSPGLAVLEGCGKVGQVARLRLVQSLVGMSIFWALLLCGAGLWAAAAVPLTNMLCTGYWIHGRGNLLRWLATREVVQQHRMQWRRDVLPLQWRMALSWASGYLIFNLFTPVVFSRYGAIEAGRLGMALNVFSAILAVGMSWVYAKAPNLTMHIARGERKELNGLFRGLFIRSTLAVALMSAALVLLAWALRQSNFSMIERIASIDVLVVLAIVTVLNAMASALATYMRAHREEPMMAPSVAMGVLVASIVYWSAGAGIFMMMLSYLLVAIALLPWTIHLFLRYYKKGG